MSELKEVPSDTNEMDIGEGQQNKDNGEQLPIQEGQEDGSQTNQSQQKAQRTPAFANQLPPSVSQQRVKPKRSTNALHLLFLESSKAYIMHDMCLKDEGDIAKLAKDKKNLWYELKAFCTSQVLEDARSSILHELTEQGKEALSDVGPDNEIINMRFDEYEALERSFEDAIAEIRYEYYEEIERRQSTGGTADVTNDEGSKAHSSSEKHPEAIPTVLRIWDQFNYRQHGKEGSDSRGDWQYGMNGDSGKYRVGRSAPGRGSYPSRQAPYFPPHRPRDGYGRGPSPGRDYRERRDRDDYYRERRYDDRRPPPLSPGPDTRRRPRDDRGPPGPGARYDDRRRDGYPRPGDDGYPRPGDDRFPGRIPPRGPPSPEREQRHQVGPIHPNLSGRPSRSTYEAPPIPASQPHPPEVPVESNYGYANSFQDTNTTYGGGKFMSSGG